MSEFDTRAYIKLMGIMLFFKYWRYWIVLIPIGFDPDLKS